MGLVWGLIIGVVILGGGYYLWSQSQDMAAPVNEGTSNQMPVPGTNTEEMIVEGGGSVNVGVGVEGEVNATPMNATVSYDGVNFTPKSVTIRKGGTVTWTSSVGNMWVASARHPDHTVYAGTTRQQHCPDASGTSFDQCQGGSNYSFTFNKVGSWNYHDHINASVFGTVVVVE